MLSHTPPKRIVVKVGTSTITHPSGAPDLRRIDELSRSLCDLCNRGAEVVLVTSGAIAVGAYKMGLSERPRELRLKQAAAAVGQCELMHVYDKLFSEYGRTAGQILLTKGDVSHEERRQNLINTFSSLLELGIIPVVNENDSVSYDEIESGGVFGDNDTLSAVVAKFIEADMLVLLSDSDGFYDADPRANPDAKLIPVVTSIDDGLLSAAGGAGSSRGTGGGITKLSAAQMALESGFDMVIASGADPSLLYDIYDGKQVGTLFSAKGIK